jgi:hypothetical protein
VAGWVRQASNSQAISGAQVCVLSSSQCATTNAQGNYSIPNVAAGNQTVRATASGYTAVQQGVAVTAGATATANFSLAAAPTWTNITTETFESGFPGAGWEVDDYYSGAGQYYWGKRTCRPRNGSYSGWAVGAGANGAGLSCGSNYPNYAFSWLVYGPFSLAGVSDAELLYDAWVNTEEDFDVLFAGASLDGNDFFGVSVSGNSSGWTSENFDLTNVPTLGNLAGQSQVWIAFVFDTDLSVTYAEGAYVDNVVLRKMMGSLAEPPAQALTCDRSQAGALVRDTCTSFTVGLKPEAKPKD